MELDTKWRHANVLVKDEDSDLTGYRRHNRLLVFGDPRTGTITVREDIRPDFPMSLEADRTKVLNGWQRQHPRGSRVVYVGSSERYWSGARSWESIDHTYEVFKPTK